MKKFEKLELRDQSLTRYHTAQKKPTGTKENRNRLHLSLTKTTFLFLSDSMLPSVDFTREECRREEKKQKCRAKEWGEMIRLTTYKVSLVRTCKSQWLFIPEDIKSVDNGYTDRGGGSTP